MKKTSSEVKIIGIMLALYPVFTLLQYLLSGLSIEAVNMIAWSAWFVLFLVLGHGVYKLNRIARLGALVVSSAIIAGPLIGIIVAPFINFDLFRKALEIHGSYTIIWMPLMIFASIFIPVFLYLTFIIYQLNRSKVKELFK